MARKTGQFASKSFDAHLTIRISEDCLQKLDKWARREGVTAATLARTIVEDAVREEKPEGDPSRRSG
jgi:predicted DNA-binding protein